MAERLIYESSNSQIYLLDESEWDVPVIRKTLNSEYPPPSETDRFYNEFEIVSGLDLPHSRKAFKRSRHKRKPALFLEYIDALTLSESVRGKQNDIACFLRLSISIAKALGDIHQHNIIHKDVSAQNILVGTHDQNITIIDFGISSKINLKRPHLGNPERLEGNLGYISPEQTGRVNRVVDYRSDLYSMGVVFYEMLTGSLPFSGKDAMEMVHAHIAQEPPSATELNETVPLQISRIIKLLLEKNAEDRYQSAYGVAHDLERCLHYLEQNKVIPEFILGESDYSGRFQIPQKLYGRQTEANTLLDAFAKASQGALKTIMVAGYSGTGKSALVHEIHKPITQKRGHFIEGKFDQFQRGVPYFAILQAFQDYVSLLLTENKDSLAKLSETIQNAVGAEGKVLTDVIPNLVHIIGDQPAVPAVGGSEAQNRFNYVFTKFVQAISNREHPIALFIDDLQWADAASLSLLKVLMSDSKNKYLLCIGAYRDNEVSNAHPTIIALNEMADLGADIETIEIGNLSRQDVNSLVAESLSVEEADCIELTNLVYHKTSGNAFFVTQFLKSLYEEGLLTFDFQKKIWEWDLEEIKQLNITDNVVELMAKKIKKLPLETQEVMKLAACIGNSFDLDILSVIHKKNSGQVKQDLQPGMGEGLIIPTTENYKFAHDRIQQAVYSLIPEEEKSKVHLDIGKLLWKDADERQRQERLFDIVNQWNKGSEIISGRGDLDLLANLNLQAGAKAREASAFRPAYTYLETGIALLPDNHWKSHYELSRDLHTQAAETAYLNGDFQQMENHIEEVLNHARELQEKVKPYEIRILAYKAQNKLIDAIHTGLDVLGQLGERFPRKATMAHVMTDLVKTKGRLRGKNVEHLANLPDMSNQEKIAAMRIIAGICSCAYWATPALFPLLVFRMCNLSLKHGNTALSAFGFSTYGVIMCGVLGDMKNGYAYGKLGLILLEKYDAREWLAQIYTPIYALINNWNEHTENTLQPLQESYHIGLETGAVEFACINANLYCIAAYLTGRQLDKIESETQAYSESFSQYKQETNNNYNEVFRQGMLNFMGRSENPLVLTGEAYDEDKMMRQNLDRNDQTGKFFIHFNKLILCYYFQDNEHALHHAEESRKLLEAVLAKSEIPNHHFYESLAILTAYESASATQKVKMMRRVKSNMRKMKKWAKDAPENYLHKYQLMNAERLRAIGQRDLARAEFDRAIEGATNQRYIHEEALGYELAGRLYLQDKSEALAEYHLKEAYNAYRQWGAEAKLRHLEQRYPAYISRNLEGETRFGTRTTVKGLSATSNRSMLDLTTVLKASTAISSEIVLKSLLGKLMKIVVENAGAQHGFLILEKQSKLLIQARYDVDQERMQVLQGIEALDSSLMAVHVIQYVHHTSDSVVINDAQNDERYAQDPYIIEHQPKSILGLPIINQGKFIGILYLENNITTGAFTQSRIELLALLSGQIAVSIDNAMLYENLEQKVEERTAELIREKRKSDELLLNILPSETAEELKQFGKAAPRSYDSVTVMFTDFKDFTNISEQLTAEQLVDEIDTCFGAFDNIMEKFGLEKIKTIGDSYMCVGGLPAETSSHAIDAVSAAIDIQDWMSYHKQKLEKLGRPIFDIRIGLHSGPLVAGVVGNRKFAYDIWGETVNTAARMESGSEAGSINISETTYSLVKDKFECEYRGKLPAKNMRDVDMYFVTGVKN
ncbi:MAG: AAA family ATPase [Acidiferrobacterales bacterium]|nr:AAA family ATPase [Acidiferrobacterales bacterium]